MHRRGRTPCSPCRRWSNEVCGSKRTAHAMTELPRLTRADARGRLKRKDSSATELTRAFLDAIARGNAELSAYVLPTPEHALKQAGESDARLSKGEARALEGLP